jgi:hypothetical protein
MSNPLQNKSKVSTSSRKKWTVVYPINTGLPSENRRILIGGSGHKSQHTSFRKREKCPDVHQNPEASTLKEKKRKRKAMGN